MKLTTKGRYAVTAMTDLAAHADAAPVGLGEIALRQGISLAYLEQIFARLRRAGLVVSARGVAGGYRLARPAGEIRVADVIAAADEEIRTTACERGSSISCQGQSARCLTHELWDELGRQIDVFLSAVTLADVLGRRVHGMAAVNPPASTPRERVGA
ncbi:MAG: RrF2 family transcriptional regulator [Parvularculaceae bacterium]|nr:RrF2 family transcriptional regulator [Parvularculaceae bacterium]